MSVSPVPGPSRSHRPASTADLAAKVLALQRRHAAAPGSSGGPSRRLEDEFDRGPAPVRQDSRTLYDPSRPVLNLGPPVESPRLMPVLHPSQQTLSVHSEDRHRRGGQHHHPPHSPHGPGRGGESGKKLFNPDVHDPVHFGSRSAAGSEPRSEPGPSRVRRPNGHYRTPEEEADRERERRRRREGSERGALSATTGSSKRREADGKSKGSRSSDGSESLKDRERGKGKGDTGVKAILKDIHNRIRSIEAELTEIHRRLSQDPDLRITAVLLVAGQETGSRRVDDNAAWMDLIGRHKGLAELHHEFLARVFDPQIPASFQQLAVKYNIPSRLWQTGFYLILERLRHAWMSNRPAALDLLTDLVYDSYKFYTELLEDQALVSFRFAWIEALGDLARYRMAIASQSSQEHASIPSGLRSPPRVGQQDLDDGNEPISSGASIGKEVADQWDVEDKDTWRTTARDWYTMGITEKPGEGRLHHHLALLSRDQRGQEGRALHHFTKSLVVTHDFATSRESILPLFDAALQSQRSLPEASAMDLFVRLHGMLFTRIQLDDFAPVMARFMERLEEDASLDGHSRKATITQVDWMLMASTNLAAILQYGASHGVVRRALAQEGNERRRLQSAVIGEPPVDDLDGEVEDDGADGVIGQPERAPSPPDSSDAPAPLTYTYALQLAFTIFDFALAHPHRAQGIHMVLNPYITIFVTFIATLFRQPPPAAVLLPAIPWRSLVDFINSARLELREETRLLNGPPLPEDWTLRGMEWVGRRTFERGFWKQKGSGRGSGAIAQPRIGERFQSEMDVLLANFDSALDITEGVVDEVDGTDLTDGPVAVNQRRWRRVAWATGLLLKHVDGLELREGVVVIAGPLKSRLDELEMEKQRDEAEERRRQARRQPIFEDEEEVLEEIESDEADAELAALRQRKQQLHSLLNQPDSRGARSTKKASRKVPNAVPGYTMLVFDTNALLQHLPLFSQIVEQGQWSVVVPLPVVTELDGLAKNPEVGLAAVQAVSYLESRVRTHSLCLKIQTSKGNYLSDLLVRTEDHHAHSHHSHPPGARDQTMDDRILGIAAFQLAHFVDRSRLLGGSKAPPGATKVLLVTFDRNLRLKARARGVEAADEQDLQAILAPV